MALTQDSPVSPIELTPPDTHHCDNAVAVPPLGSPSDDSQEDPCAPTSKTRMASWLPFTLQWYYLAIPTILSFAFGIVLVYLGLYSNRNHGLGTDDGSSAILFGWRFTPTLIAVLYAQMTAILFEDVKRTEPFVRLATASPGGASAFGTVLQSPRAWWSIFIDVCFRRKRTGKTSWSLICAALLNVLTLLAISPLSSALLSSEEILVPQSVGFTKLVVKANTQIPAVATRETYFRTMSALMRNISTSAWVTDTSLTFPFWPSSEVAQFGPQLVSSYGAWTMEAITLQPSYECKDMTLESAEMSNKYYSDVYSVQQYGPYKGTQPMVTFLLSSDDGCKYELSIHPAMDLASKGGVTWSNASTFYPTGKSILPFGGKVIYPNVTSTHVYARLNASEECNGRDIIIMSTPWTVPLNRSENAGFLSDKQTYERSPGFRMRGMLCSSQYFVSKRNVSVDLSESSQISLNIEAELNGDNQTIPESLVNIPQFQALSMQDDWNAYFDKRSLMLEAIKTSGREIWFPQFSGMAPMLAALSNYNVTSMIDDFDIGRKAARIKGRFFMETISEAFNSPELVQTDDVGGATLVEERVVVLTEIGFTLAALFFTSTILLAVVFWNSRLPRRPLNLQSDPASTVGLSLLLQPSFARASTFRSMQSASRSEFYAALQRERYLTSGQSLFKGDTEYALVSPAAKTKRDWRPLVIQVRWLFALCLLLTLIMAAVLILDTFSARSRLSQVAFIYEADVSKLKLSFPTFAPISIAPTVVSIVIGLWWDQLDTTFRILQPYISMSRGPTPIYAGAGLTYRSKSWVGAAFKAARYRHWVLFMVTVGSILVQVLTVSMSALFEKQTTNSARQISFQQDLEIRQTPLTSEVTLKQSDGQVTPSIKVLDELYLDASKSWLYGAGIQYSFNESQLPWTADGWSFLPVDLTDVLNFTNTPLTSRTTADNLTITSSNISFRAPAIRARLECNPVEETSNVSSWLELANLTLSDYLLPEGFSHINKSQDLEMYKLTSDMFAKTKDKTTMLSKGAEIVCCTNGTGDDPQRAVMGYWSPVLSSKGNTFPYDDMSWPLPIISKWVVGKPINIRQLSSIDPDFYFEEVPRIQAARCQPIIETAEASVLVDTQSKTIYSYEINGPAITVDPAWSDVFTRRERVNDSSTGPWNISTSFGVLFLDSLLGSAVRQTQAGKEDPDDNAFAFRDQERGINMDLMTNSMYTLADKDPEALLNYTTLVDFADRTFQTFFQHFVNSGLSLKSGGYAYQPVNDQTRGDMGLPFSANGTVKSERETPAPKTNRDVTATVWNRIRVLHLNTVATYLSTAILIWLIGTTLIIICLQRKYTSSMIRDVQLIADMLVLVAGSDNFLGLVHQKGVALKKDRHVKTMLGWFKDRDGEVRWGIEVVGGRNAVEWVEAPKQGWHVRKTSSSSRRLLPWNKN